MLRDVVADGEQEVLGEVRVALWPHGYGPPDAGPNHHIGPMQRAGDPWCQGPCRAHISGKGR